MGRRCVCIWEKTGGGVPIAFALSTHTHTQNGEDGNRNDFRFSFGRAATGRRQRGRGRFDVGPASFLFCSCRALACRVSLRPPGQKKKQQTKEMARNFVCFFFKKRRRIEGNGERTGRMGGRLGKKRKRGETSLPTGKQKLRRWRMRVRAFVTSGAPPFLLFTWRAPARVSSVAITPTQTTWLCVPAPSTWT